MLQKNGSRLERNIFFTSSLFVSAQSFCLLVVAWNQTNIFVVFCYQRWSPRGLILKSLTLASKPQVLENCPVLGSRTALFLNRWNFVGKRQKPCGKSAKPFFWFPQVEIAWKKIFEDLFRLKKIFEDLFFWEHLRLCPCPWPREGLSLASKFFCVLGLGLEPWVLDYTSVCYSVIFTKTSNLSHFTRWCEQLEISACCVAKLNLIYILIDHSLFKLLRF